MKKYWVLGENFRISWQRHDINAWIFGIGCVGFVIYNKRKWKEFITIIVRHPITLHHHVLDNLESIYKIESSFVFADKVKAYAKRFWHSFNEGKEFSSVLNIIGSCIFFITKRLGIGNENFSSPLLRIF